MRVFLADVDVLAAPDHLPNALEPLLFDVPSDRDVQVYETGRLLEFNYGHKFRRRSKSLLAMRSQPVPALTNVRNREKLHA
jgi:hypothetical protein